MAETLKLKWGSYKNLPAAISNSDIGTIFVTKDEGSLYLGAASGQAPMRIQGTVQYHSNLTSFAEGVTPPYSPEVIYYIASVNALVRWDNTKYVDGQGKEQDGKFVRINVTAAEFDTLSATVSQHQTNITNINTQVGTNTTNIENLQTTTAALEEAVEALEALTGTGGAGDSLTSRIAALESWTTTYQTIIEDHGVSIHELSEGKVDKTTLEGVTKQIATLEADNATNKDNISALATSVETINDTTVPNLTKLIGDNSTNIQNLSDQFAGYYTRTEVDTLNKSVTDAINATNQTVGTQGSNITALQNWKTNTADAAVAQVALNKTNIQTLSQSLSNYYTKAQADNLHKTLQDTINSEVAAVNCLTYRSSISTSNAFTSLSNITIGSTYIVTATVTLSINGFDTVCYAGDLLIATAKSGKTEGADGFLAASDINWVHVQSGYYKTHEGVLKSADSKLTLTSMNGNGTLGDLGQITLTNGDTDTDKHNLVIDTSTANTISFKLEWLSF